MINFNKIILNTELPEWVKPHNVEEVMQAVDGAIEAVHRKYVGAEGGEKQFGDFALKTGDNKEQYTAQVFADTPSHPIDFDSMTNEELIRFTQMRQALFVARGLEIEHWEKTNEELKTEVAALRCRIKEQRHTIEGNWRTIEGQKATINNQSLHNQKQKETIQNMRVDNDKLLVMNRKQSETIHANFAEYSKLRAERQQLELAVVGVVNLFTKTNRREGDEESLCEGVNRGRG